VRPDKDIIDALWAQIEPVVYITREQFASGLEQWDVEPVLVTPEGVLGHVGELAFVALTKGPEFHFASFGTGAAISLRMIRARLAQIIERRG
jgi:hypothetical protein